MSAAILCIGTELTRGEIHNTNATWLCDQLTSLGVTVSCTETVADDERAIVASLKRLGDANALIICTGGLGPTTDDLTALCVARALGVPLVRHAPSVEAIRQYVESRGHRMTPSNEKQADFPEGSQVLPNPVGTAPGFHVCIGKAEAFFLPGVPREMHHLFSAHVAGFAAALTKRDVHQIRLKTFGLPESTVNDKLAGVEEQYGVVVGYRAHFPEIEVKLLAVDSTALGSAEQRSHAAARRVRELVGDYVYAEGPTTFAEATVNALRECGWSFAVAESCTGGLVSHLLTQHSVSDVFLGAAVTYANAAKLRVLGVSAGTLEAHGAVSIQVAKEMASGARVALGADCALSLTGIAGPSGGTADKPLGRVYIAVATPEEVLAEELELGRYGDRDRIQRAAAYRGLQLVRRAALKAKRIPDPQSVQ